MSLEHVGTIAGMPIATDINMTVPYEDWSKVRSPSRAMRRLKRGFRQNIVHRRRPSPNFLRIGRLVVMHPETLAALRFEMERANGR